MEKIKKVLVEICSRKFFAVIISAFFVLGCVVNPIFADFNSIQGEYNTNDVLQNSQAGVTAKIEGESTFVKNISVDGKKYAVFQNGDRQFAIQLQVQGEVASGTVNFDSENVTIVGAVDGLQIVNTDQATLNLDFNSLQSNNAGNDAIISAPQANSTSNATVAQKQKKTTVLKAPKKATTVKKSSKAKSNKSTKSKKKTDKTKKKSNKSVKQTTKKYTDKKGNVHSSKITTTKIKNKKGKVVKTIISTKSTVKNSAGKDISTTEKTTTITKNKKGGFTRKTNSVTKNAEGKITKEVNQTLNIDNKGKVSGTKTVTDKDGNKVTYDVTGTRKVSEDKNGNKTVVYNLTLKDQKTGDIMKVKTENIYNKSGDSISAKRWENGNLTKVEANGVLQYTRDSKGNANFYKNGNFDHTVNANEFKGLSKAQCNEVVQKEITSPGKAKGQIAKFKQQNAQKSAIWKSFEKSKIDNYTYDKGKLTVTGANGYKIVINYSSDDAAKKLGDKIWAAKSTSALKGLLDSHQVKFYKGNKVIAEKKKGRREMDLVF